jgi:hypothetical protein
VGLRAGTDEHTERGGGSGGEGGRGKREQEDEGDEAFHGEDFLIVNLRSFSDLGRFA